MDYALRVLSRRRVSCEGLRGLMSRKGFQEAESEPCLAKLKEWGYLDDQEYAKDVLRAVGRECPVGKMRAAFELRKRAIDPDLARKVVDETYEGVSEEAIALEAARKYMNGKDAGSLKEKERERLAKWLLRRGFRYESVRSALSAIGQGDPE
jgi:regulatory protein